MRTTGMGTPIARYCLALVAILLLASGAFAQSTTNGAIGGTVTDQSGAVVPNAGVSTKNLGTGASASGKSDEGGRSLSDNPFGAWRVLRGDYGERICSLQGHQHHGGSGTHNDH